jgi:hypothetical protein
MRIVKDFPEEDVFDYDQYGNVHLCFCGPCDPFIMEKIKLAPKLVQRLYSFLEVNIDFTVFTDNIFLARIAPYQLKSN